MSNIIKLLPDSVANQIAAGEVIQRPASAVKELLENSIDAGATSIDLIIKDAGKTLIQVIDNGTGMSAMDARMCFERHATSKISKADDLFAIRTMGFRGEALASIAAIAQVEVKTKPHGDELGTCLKIEGSTLVSQEACQCRAGSNILVKNLFFNVPARRNFLKSNTTETRHVIEEFIRVAVFQPDISFSMTHNGKSVYQLISGNLKSRIIGLFGKAYDQRLLRVEQATDKLNIHGFIGKPEFAKKTRGEQYFFVNNRFIRQAYLNHAVTNAYTELMPADAFPTYFLNINVDPNEIDINIHPTKTEVNFRDIRYVYSVIHSAVKQAVGKHSLTPTIDFNVDPAIEAVLGEKPDREIKHPQIIIDPEYNPFTKTAGKGIPGSSPWPTTGDWKKVYTGTVPGQENKEGSPSADDQNLSIPTDEQGKFYLLHTKYILTGVRSGLMVIDLQKAHKRILYEQYLEQLTGRDKASQQQLFPHNLHFSPGDAEILRSLKNDLEKLGFVIEAFGNSGFVVNGIPADLLETDVEAVLEKIVENHKLYAKDLNYDKNAILARSMAANTAVKPGTKLLETEMADIFNRLFACKVPEVAPDGSKIVTIIALADIEKWMKK
ncbi:MAG TPA: DNA mismatch repair endonuclease MutL [Bacteroidetes bacterium]|nr:DNA mismatch repair endonuclease MutL [Bacteroidota bacterium]